MDAALGEFGPRAKSEPKRLTEGPWMDTHCKWSPRGDLIVFSSNRDKPENARYDLDSGYYSVYLVKPDDPTVVIRVIGSGTDFAGHVNHPFFSPDGKSIVVASDLAAVSVDPISLPAFLHSARPYGDIFTIDDIDQDNIRKNKNVTKFNRVTHSRYENSTGTWTDFSTHDPNAAWNKFLYEIHEKNKDEKKPSQPCPYMNDDQSRGMMQTSLESSLLSILKDLTKTGLN